MPAEVNVDEEVGRKRATERAKVLAASPVLPEHKIAGKTPAARGCSQLRPAEVERARGATTSTVPSRKPFNIYIYIVGAQLPGMVPQILLAW